ncbi:MAG: arylsulfatase, partial [Bacteroidetes bacterium]|nr:arylsulfatase [Bacteroidota bacterium]
VSWPGLKTRPGGFSDELTHAMDILPTALDLTGAPYPKEYAGHAINDMDGRSLLPVFLKKKRQSYAQLFFEHEGGKALIEGDWKLVYPKRKSWELYNLKTDRTESTNLMDKYPDKAREMQQKYDVWSRRMGIPAE